MPAEEAVLDTPEVVEPVEGAEPVEPIQGGEQDSDEEFAEIGGEKRDMRKLPAYIRDMKETNRNGYRDAVARYWRDVDTQKLTNGFDVKGTRAWLDEKGGREAFEMTVSELQTKAQEFDGILGAIQSGDGSVASRLIEQAGENATPIATAVLNEWAKADPDAYRTVLGSVVDGALSSSPLPMGFERVDMFLGMLADTLNNQQIPESVKIAQTISAFSRVQGELKPMREFLGSFRQQPGQTQAQQPQRGNPKVDQRAQDLDRREAEMFQTDLRRDVDTFRSGEIMRHLKALPGFKADDKETIDDAMRATTRDVSEQMAGDKTYQQQLNSLQQKRDKDGMMRLIKSREAKAIEQIAPRWGRKLFGQPGPQVKKQEPPQPRQERQPAAFSRPPAQQTRSQILRAALAE